MPHQCTGCGHTFEDGSKEMLSGCPDCGGNKFQFRPSGAAADTDDDASGDPGAPDGAPEPSNAEPPQSDRPDPDASSVAETVGRATTQLRDFVSPSPETPADSGDGETPTADTSDRSGAPDASPSPDASTASDASESPNLSSSASSDSTSPDSASSDSTSPDPEAEWPDGWDEGPSDQPASPDSTRDERSSTGVGASDADTPETTDRNPDVADDDIIDADARREDARGPDSGEDLAQANARSDVVSPSELDDKSANVSANAPGAPHASDDPTTAGTGTSPAGDPDPPSDGEVVSEPTGEEPDLADLREQLNDQFESIKILEPGQYELNLMELYDREEYIIALQENGRYVIQVPEQWMGEDPDDR